MSRAPRVDFNDPSVPSRCDFGMSGTTCSVDVARYDFLDDHIALWPRQWPKSQPFSLHCSQSHPLVSYTAQCQTLPSHYHRKDVACPTCHRLTSSSPSSTPLGRPSPNGTLFCSTVRSGGRINRCVLLSILSPYLYEPSSIGEYQSFSFRAMLGPPTRSVQ